MKMANRKSRLQFNRMGKVGLLTFLLINASFIFLMLSPYIPNVLGEMLDEQYFQEAQERIEQIRKGQIKIHVQYSNGSPAVGTSVLYNHSSHEFLFGAMCFHYNIYTAARGFDATANQSFADLFKKVFNLALIAFYWDIWSAPDVFEEEQRVNETIAFCEANNITTKGHCLIWNHDACIPDWMDYENMNDTAKLTAFENHIKDTLTKYKDKISYWDIINEIAHRPFPEFDTKELINLTFNWARETDPSAGLIINDYAMLGHDFGYGPTAQLYSQLNAMNTPYDAIGMQAHAFENDWIPTYEIWWTLEGFKKLNKPIHITEVFVPSVPVPITNSWKKGLWSEENQAEYIRRLYTMVFSHPSVDSISWWGFRDGAYRVNDTYGNGFGLVNPDFSPKPAYEMIDQLVNHDWHTEGTQNTDSSGDLEFQGYYGIYNLTISGSNYQIFPKVGELNEFNITI